MSIVNKYIINIKEVYLTIFGLSDFFVVFNGDSNFFKIYILYIVCTVCTLNVIGICINENFVIKLFLATINDLFNFS